MRWNLVLFVSFPHQWCFKKKMIKINWIEIKLNEWIEMISFSKWIDSLIFHLKWFDFSHIHVHWCLFVYIRSFFDSLSLIDWFDDGLKLISFWWSFFIISIILFEWLIWMWLLTNQSTNINHTMINSIRFDFVEIW